MGVRDLALSVRFYSSLFGTAPVVRKPDYAKWMLDDPRINFAISSCGTDPGVRHLGLQAESTDELAAIGVRFAAADGETAYAEPNARCCYAHSDKQWVRDPQGIVWEGFYTRGSPGETVAVDPPPATGSSCCPVADAAADPKAATPGDRAPCCS
jgi:hypothetical protein